MAKTPPPRKESAEQAAIIRLLDSCGFLVWPTSEARAVADSGPRTARGPQAAGGGMKIVRKEAPYGYTFRGCDFRLSGEVIEWNAPGCGSTIWLPATEYIANKYGTTLAALRAELTEEGGENGN